jgi:hypothetical protein
MPRMRINRCARLRLTANSMAILAAAEERALQIQFVELPHQAQVLRALRLRLVIVGRARHAQQFAPLLDGEPRMSWIDP